jgi:hypothetical protein
MFGFQLTLKRLAGGRLALGVPPGYRLLLAGIGLIILVSLVTTPGGRPVSLPADTLALILILVTFLSAAYQERWVFDRDADALVYQAGTVFWHRDRRYRISELASVELSRFTRGRLPGSQPDAPPGRLTRGRVVLTLAVHLSDGTTLRLESGRYLHKERMERIGLALAGYCGIPFASRV